MPDKYSNEQKGRKTSNRKAEKTKRRKGVTIRETGVGEKLTPVFLSFTATLFRLRGLKILLLFF